MPSPGAGGRGARARRGLALWVTRCCRGRLVPGCALAWLPARETSSDAECGCSRPQCISMGWGGGGPTASSQTGLSSEISIISVFSCWQIFGFQIQGSVFVA